MGAKIVVTEIDQVRALQAHMDGFKVAKMDDTISEGDIFITVTGCKDVLTVEQIKKMKPGAILANSGHFNVEIQVDEMYEAAASNSEIRPNFRKFDFSNGTHVYLVGEGRLANLVAAEGHPSEVMDLSFCGQAFALKFLVENRGNLTPEVYTLPPEVDQEIGKLKLATLGISIDQLTADQLAYVSDWQSGT
jgi:adenosylhomocysteinase